MATHKKFMMYAIWVILFFIFSKVMIYVAINSTYKNILIKVDNSLITRAEVKANAVSGTAKITLKNNTSSDLQNKYIAVNCYSKNNVLMGTKYINIAELTQNQEKEYETRFNFNKVDNVKIDIIDELPKDTNKQQILPDKEMTGMVLIGAIIVLMFI